MVNLKSRSDYLLLAVKNLIKVYVILLFIMTLFRIGFTFYFGEPTLFSEYSQDLGKAFFLGWKYDSLVISYSIIPVYFISLLVSFTKSRYVFNAFQFIYQLYFLAITLLIVFILACDMGFYSFFQDHLNILFFGLLEDDTVALIETIQKNYPVWAMIAGVLGIVLFVYYLFRKVFRYTDGIGSSITSGFVKFNILNLFVLALLIGGARGGYGMMVISPKYSDFSENEFINQISLNGIITFEKAYKLRKRNNSKDYNLPKMMGYAKIQDAFTDYLGLDVSYSKEKDLVSLIKRTTPKNPMLEKIKPHVVVFVMESFGANWLQYHSEKFNILGGLEKHFSEDHLFHNFISSDNGTIGSLISIATNIPNRPGARFLSESKYMQTPLESSAQIPYSKKGYETSFMYGGKLGWRDIGKYFRYQKYDNLIGENAIKKELNLKGRQGTEWGLYDEHLFNMVKKQLQESTRSQFALVLSTSNHPPFENPTTYKAMSLEIPGKLDAKIRRERELFKKRFLSFQYANNQLAKFISDIKNSELGKKTIIAVTGDHNFWGFVNYDRSEAFYKHTVPFYIYVPKEIELPEVDYKKIASHDDIMTTLYNLSLPNVEYISFGEDLFSDVRSFAIGGNLYAGDEGIIYRGHKYKWSTIPNVDLKTEENFVELEKHYKSTLSVADFFLRYSYEK